MMRNFLFVFALLGMLSSCSDDDDDNNVMVLDPSTAAVVSVDRFSENAGTLMVRTATNGLPEANEPINFDAGAPFITEGLAADGSMVKYYNFDVQSDVAAPIFAFFHENGDPVEGQMNIINVIPGESGYSDFWQVNMVIVPDSYLANTIGSYDAIMASGYTIEATSTLVNCPVVPEGSKASLRYTSSESNGLIKGWYKEQVVYYFSFLEKDLDGGASNTSVPLSPIYVSFNLNPDANNAASGPASGFVVEEGSMQTHNVIATVPMDDSYSPLWSVNVYDNADFESVMDLTSATSANILATGVAKVNCPVVFKMN